MAKSAPRWYTGSTLTVARFQFRLTNAQPMVRASLARLRAQGRQAKIGDDDDTRRVDQGHAGFRTGGNRSTQHYSRRSAGQHTAGKIRQLDSPRPQDFAAQRVSVSPSGAAHLPRANRRRQPWAIGGLLQKRVSICGKCLSSACSRVAPMAGGASRIHAAARGQSEIVTRISAARYSAAHTTTANAPFTLAMLSRGASRTAYGISNRSRLSQPQ